MRFGYVQAALPDQPRTPSNRWPPKNMTEKNWHKKLNCLRWMLESKSSKKIERHDYFCDEQIDIQIHRKIWLSVLRCDSERNSFSVRLCGFDFIGCLSDQNSATPVALLNSKSHNYTMIYVMHDTKWMESDVLSVAYADAKPSSFTSVSHSVTRCETHRKTRVLHGRLRWVQQQRYAKRACSLCAPFRIFCVCAFFYLISFFFSSDRRQSVLVLSVETFALHVPR